MADLPRFSRGWESKKKRKIETKYTRISYLASLFYLWSVFSISGSFRAILGSSSSTIALLYI